MNNIKTQIFKGLKWTSIATVINSIVKLLQVAILTKFLSKSEFGTIAIALVFISFTNVFLDMGISTAIMHKQNIPKNHYSSLFWFNIFIGVILTLILIMIAPYISYYNKDESLTHIIQFLSLNVLFYSMGMQHRTQRHKQLDFKFMSSVEVLISVLTLIVAYVLAINNYKVYSLVYSSVLNVLLSNLIFMLYGVFKDRNIYFHFNLKEIRAYLKIGVFQLGSGVLDFFSRELDILIVNHMFGKEILGAYSLCKKLAQTFYSVTNPIIIKTTTPVFAKIQYDINRLRQVFLKLSGIVSTTNLPIYFLIGLLSPEILVILYGSDYVEYSWVLTFLVCSYALMIVPGLFSSAQIALGRTDVGFYWTIYRIVSTFIVIYIGALYSLEYLSFLLFMNTAFNFIPFWLIQVKPLLKMSFLIFLKPQVYPFIFSLLILVVLSMLMPFTISDFNIFLKVFMFLFLYITCFMVFDKKNYTINIFLVLFKKFLS